MLQACDRVNAITAHEQVRGGRAAVLECESDVFLRFFDLGRALAAGEGDVLLLLYSRQDTLEGITASNTQGLVGWVANAFSIWSAKVGCGESGGVNIEDLQIVNFAAIISFADDRESTQVVEKPQGVGCEVDGTANGGWFRADLEDADSGDLAFGSVLCEGESGGQACNATTEDDDIQTIFGWGSHDWF